EQSAREGSSVALFYLDIDLFMAVNDAFGRDIGDAVLKEVADRLRTWNLDGSVAAGERSGGRPLLASAGGNAFTLLIANVAGQDQATSVAQQLMQVIAQPIAVEGQSLVLTASIGIAFFPGDAVDLPELMRCA